MAQAEIIPITAAKRPATTTTNVIDFKEARRVALMRRLWAQHDLDGSAR